MFIQQIPSIPPVEPVWSFWVYWCWACTCRQFIVQASQVSSYQLVTNFEAGRGAVARGVTANRLVVGSIPTRGDEIFT